MKVVLIGDSIRIGYLPLVSEKMTECEVWGPDANCRHSLWALDHFPEWVEKQNPDILHFNFGIHDSSFMEDGEHQIVLSQYTLCLKRFIAKAKEIQNLKMIWATTTPLYVPDKDTPMSEWKLREKTELPTYNASALEIVRSAEIPVNDLHGEVMRNDYTKCICEDGCHMTPYGNEVLSNAVVKAIRAVL